MIISPARYLGPLIVLIGLGAALVVADGLMKVGLGATSRWLDDGEYPADRAVVTHAGERLSAIAGKGRSPGRVGLLLGQSTLECGIDPAVLDAESGLPIRWLNLYGVGGSLNKIGDIADLVFAARLVPEVVVIAINPYMLTGIDYGRVRRAERSLSGNWIKPWVWTLENRVVFNHVVQTEVHRARLALIRWFGNGIGTLYPAGSDPWTVEATRSTHSNPDQLRTRLEYDRSIGWLDPANYATTESNPKTLARLIRRFREAGSRVVIVRMPERSPFREAVPREAVDTLETVAREGQPGGPVPVVNLVDQVPDALFLDLDHLDPDGRVACTKALARRLRELLAEPTATAPPAASRNRGPGPDGPAPARTDRQPL